MHPGHVLVCPGGKVGGVAVAGEEGRAAGIYRFDLVNPTKPMLGVDYMVTEKILQEGHRVVYGEDLDVWCACGLVCLGTLLY